MLLLCVIKNKCRLINTVMYLYIMGKKIPNLIKKEIINLHYNDGLSTNKIAKKTGVSYSSVYGLTKLQEKINPETDKPFSSNTEYQNFLAKKKGFASHNKYQEHLLDKQGFTSRHEYQEHLAQEKGFNSRHEYQEHLKEKAKYLDDLLE